MDITNTKREISKILGDLSHISQDAIEYIGNTKEILALYDEIHTKFKKEHKKAELVPAKYGVDEKYPSEHYTQTRELIIEFDLKKESLISKVSNRNHAKHSQYLTELLELLQKIELESEVRSLMSN